MLGNRSTLDKILIASVSLVVLALIILGATTLLQPVTTTSQPILYNAFFPDTVTNGSFRYYNGNSFIKYDIASGKTSDLVPSLRLPIENLTAVYWLPDAVVFTARVIPVWSPLYDSYQKQTEGTDGSRSVYWYMPFASGIPEVFLTTSSRPNSPFTQVGADRLLYYDRLSLRTLESGKKVTQLYKVGDSLDQGYIEPLFVDTSSVYYLFYTDKNVDVMQYKTIEKKVSKIESAIAAEKAPIPNIRALMVDPSHLVLLDKSTDDPSKYALIDIDLATHVRRSLIMPFGGSLTKTANSISAIFTAKSRLQFLNVENNKLSLVAQIDDNYSMPYQAQCSEDHCYYFEDGGVVRLVTDNSKMIQAIKPGTHDAIESKISIQNGSLKRAVLSFQDNSYILTTTEGDLSQSYLQVKELIRQKGYDPNQITIILSPGMAVNF